MNVKDKVAVVTGGASGIGLALCTRFAAEGAHVVLSDLEPGGLRARGRADRRIPRRGRCRSRGGRREPRVEATVERFGRIDLFVSNAGIASRRRHRHAYREVAEDHRRQPHVGGLRRQVRDPAHARAGQRIPAERRVGRRPAGHLRHRVAYTVTKHAAVGFTEWLAAMYDDQSDRREPARPGSRQHADPRRQGGHPGGTGRDHNRGTRRHRRSRGSPRSAS